jgi:hypothetical protein
VITGIRQRQVFERGTRQGRRHDIHRDDPAYLGDLVPGRGDALTKGKHGLQPSGLLSSFASRSICRQRSESRGVYVVAPLPIPDFQHVLAVFIDVLLVYQLVLTLLLQIDALVAGLRHAVDGVHHEMEAYCPTKTSQVLQIHWALEHL